MGERRRLLILFVSLAVFTGTALASQGKLTFRGTTSPGAGSSAEENATLEVHGGSDRTVNRLVSGSIAAGRVPMPATSAVVGVSPGFFGFNGVSHRDQKLSGTGAYANTQLSIEPPDQALSVGNGFVLEAVNGALAIYDTSGARLIPPVSLSQFFNLSPQVNRTALSYGDIISDPRSYYDPDTDRWFLTVLQVDTNSSTGASGPRAHVEIGVSKTGDPRGDWNLFSLDTTDDGENDTPSHPNCPCQGDQPLIGADANGFYISTNEYNLSAPNMLNGAQIYAMSKTALAEGRPPTVIQIDTGTIATPDTGAAWYSLQPATIPPGGSYANSTEYFLSALNFPIAGIAASPGLDNRIAVWALTGTDTLNGGTPNLSLKLKIIDSETYAIPPDAQQKEGPRPLAQVFLPQLDGGGTPPEEELELLASGDSRMNQVIFADGKLWSAINTAVKAENGSARVGIAYFIVAPSVSNESLNASVVNQGYIAVDRNNVMYPSVGVNAAGKGTVAFTLAGPDFYPSAAYAPIDAINGTGDIHVAGTGAGPEDGFTGYRFFGSEDGVASWGDYSAATSDAQGNIWIAAEYIPNAPRTMLVNWGTFIGKVTP